VVDAGQVLFGENRLHEGEEKIPNLPHDLEWHFIGGLQRNKIRRVLPLFPVIHSLASMKLARFTNRVAGELGLTSKIYLEVNIGAEESKHGFSPDELRGSLEEMSELTHLDWQGLMCIPPRAATPEDARPWFAKVRELQEELEATSGQKLPGLSMGMSGDFEVAIEEGSTIVRVGSAIFGPRIKKL
jgi:pyridoxal phosphate enzyme (YggS family)